MQWTAIRANFLAAACISIIAGAALFSLIVPTEDTTLSAFVQSRAVIEGVVVRDPDVREASIRLTVMPETVNGQSVSGSKHILISADPFTTVSYGDRVRATGLLRAPSPFETDTGRTFNYPKYLFAHGVSHELSFATVATLEQGKGNRVVAALLSIKHAFIRSIERALTEPYAALASGLLLGEKQSLGDEVTKAFRNAGVVHIIVLSGYNVSLVINSVLFISLRVLPRFLGYATAAVFVVAFAVVTGASETTLRATIMALLMMVARVLNRPRAALRGLLIAASAMALANPFLVLYDLSFQLSVAATLGLVLFSDGIARRITFVPRRLGLREITATTIATQITVLPLLILSVGAVSLVFLPANVLVLPAVPVAMLLGFGAAFVALFAPSLALIASFPAYLALAYIVEISKFFGTLPFAAVAVSGAMSWVALVLIALIYGVVVLRYVTHRGAASRLPLRSGS